MITVGTTFSPEGYERYGKQFIDSFYRYWPKSIKLICGYEGEAPRGVTGFDLLSIEPAKSFIERYKDDPFVKGKMEHPLSPWGPKAHRDGYCFRHDAYKFSRKVFALAHISRNVDMGKMFFIDADVVTHKRVPEQFLHDLLPDTTSLCYLARERYHSELGFVGYNLDRLEAHEFITAYEWRYETDAFLSDPHWDDCNQFDALVKRLRPATQTIPHRSRAQPFDNSALGLYMTHNKGPRK